MYYTKPQNSTINNHNSIIQHITPEKKNNTKKKILSFLNNSKNIRFQLHSKSTLDNKSKKKVRTSSWPARDTFSFLNTEVSKSREIKGFTLGTDDTILAPKTPPVTLPLLALSGLKVLEDTDDENPKLLLHRSDLDDADFRVFDGVGVVRVVEKDVAAAAISVLVRELYRKLV
jgi:hypothetical protein